VTVNWPDRLLVIFILIAVPLLLIAFPLWLLFGGLRTFALRPLARQFEDIVLHDPPEPGDVSFTYHTYRGLLLWVTQEEHRVSAPIVEAEKLLNRLWRFNLSWGLLSRGFLFIPFLATGNYLTQRRAIRRQAATMSEQELFGDKESA
jgi:hypothetical protein